MLTFTYLYILIFLSNYPNCIQLPRKYFKSIYMIYTNGKVITYICIMYKTKRYENGYSDSIND